MGIITETAYILYIETLNGAGNGARTRDPHLGKVKPLVYNLLI